MNQGNSRARYSIVDLGWKGTLVLTIVIIVGLNEGGAHMLFHFSEDIHTYVQNTSFVKQMLRKESSQLIFI
ncbi:hypothetical protein ACWGNC_29520, partial [Paenibacillus lautus]